jgi:hypothetical protein
MAQDLFGFDPAQSWMYENGFYLTSSVARLGKLLAHYHLYRSISRLPGHVVECGVYKGASLIRFASFRELLESPYSRKVIGFDAFGTFPAQADSEDAAFIDRFEAEGGPGMPLDVLHRVMAYKGFVNYELIAGDIVETVPCYVREHPELKIAFLHLDVDVYRPSVVTLEHLYPHVVRGGLMVFDDFGSVAGETRAIDEFLACEALMVHKLPLSHSSAFCRKP